MDTLSKVLLAIATAVSLILLFDIHRRTRSLEIQIDGIVQKFDATPVESEFGAFSDAAELSETETSQDLPV